MRLDNLLFVKKWIGAPRTKLEATTACKRVYINQLKILILQRGVEALQIGGDRFNLDNRPWAAKFLCAACHACLPGRSRA